MQRGIFKGKKMEQPRTGLNACSPRLKITSTTLKELLTDRRRALPRYLNARLADLSANGPPPPLDRQIRSDTTTTAVFDTLHLGRIFSLRAAAGLFADPHSAANMLLYHHHGADHGVTLSGRHHTELKWHVIEFLE
jgi:hypothetical protein